jgi:hypothetical protein
MFAVALDRHLSSAASDISWGAVDNNDLGGGHGHGKDE